MKENPSLSSNLLALHAPGHRSKQNSITILTLQHIVHNKERILSPLFSLSILQYNRSNPPPSPLLPPRSLPFTLLNNLPIPIPILLSYYSPLPNHFSTSPPPSVLDPRSSILDPRSSHDSFHLIPHTHTHTF